MRPTVILTLSAALGSIALVAAHAGGSPASVSRVVGASSRPATVLQARERGASPYANCTAQRARRARMAHDVPSMGANTLPAYLYVVDGCGPAIDVLRAGTYRESGLITNGLNAPTDAFVDLHGNLYVTNFLASAPGGYVAEYAPGAWNAPSFTYNANMYYPEAVTTDARGNVYEGDSTGFINEYSQNRNVSIASCQPVTNGDGTSVLGVAVDGHNDVFATVLDYGTGTSELVEYPGGLNNCLGLTVLPLQLRSMYGIAVDKNANLLIAHVSGVAVVDPPYSTVNAQIGTGFVSAVNVRLNRANGLAFVTDTVSQTVTIVNYPSGTNVAVLGTAYDISEPTAAVEQPNAVY